MTLRIMTFSTITPGIITLSTITLSTTTLSIATLTQHYDIQPNYTSIMTLRVITFSVTVNKTQQSV
jgi:hypothetical protein